MELLSSQELENLSISDRKDYFIKLREECLSIRDNQLKIGQGIIKSVYPALRGYKLELEGVENIPKDSNVIFIVNHSNSHDIFTAYEVLSALERKGSVMVATDCLTPITTEIFNFSDATLLSRRIKEERQASIFGLSHKILEGKDGVIFGESTWNLHPILPMHNIKKGGSIISAITQAPIVPTIFEYIEQEGPVKSEWGLYKKCIIRFDKPIIINPDISLISQTGIVKSNMINMRSKIWRDYGVKRDNLCDVDPLTYINHTYIKKFKAFGFTYDSQKEQEYLLFLNGEPRENEYTIDNEGNFVPGITSKSFELKKTLRK